MKKINEILLTILGTAIFTYSISAFIIPYNILSGGVAGVAILLVPFIQVDLAIMASAIQIILFIVGFIMLGKKFAINTFISSITYSILLPIFQKYLPTIEVDIILAALYGGLIGGFGIGIVFRQGGSTGGMDVPCEIMNRYLKIELTKCFLIVDCLTIMLGIVIYGIPTVLVGLITAYTCAITISKVVTGGKRSKQIQIISDFYQDINNDMMAQLGRGSTFLIAQGGYTKNDKKVLSIVVNEKEYVKIMQIVHKYDQSAFVIVSDVHDVHGEGFTFKIRQ